MTYEGKHISFKQVFYICVCFVKVLLISDNKSAFFYVSPLLSWVYPLMCLNITETGESELVIVKFIHHDSGE